MKKNYFITSIMMLFVAMFSLASCDTDDIIYTDDYGYDVGWNNSGYLNNRPRAVSMSNVLKGAWRGNTKVSYSENGQIVNDVMNTEINFSQAKPNATYGEGYQVDYQNGQAVSSRTFSWNVDYATCDILINYRKSDGNIFSMRIDYNDLNLNDRTFTGIMIGYNEEDDFDYRRYGYSRIFNLSPMKALSE